MSCWFGSSPLTPLACFGVFAAGLSATSSCRNNGYHTILNFRRLGKLHCIAESCTSQSTYSVKAPLRNNNPGDGTESTESTESHLEQHLADLEVLPVSVRRLHVPAAKIAMDASEIRNMTAA